MSSFIKKLINKNNISLPPLKTKEENILNNNNKPLATTSSNFYSTEDTFYKQILPDEIYEEFIEILTIDKLHEFFECTKQKEMENLKHTMKLKKNQFIQIMKIVFIANNENFNLLYEFIFNRFKIFKAELKSTSHKNSDQFYISKIYSDDEIDIFEINLALTMFIKCNFETKLRLLFEITDSDDDGFINEEELKKLIFTLNYMFCDEENSFGVESTILKQSLISIKIKDSLDKLMKFPGELEKIFDVQIYIEFNTFYNALKKIDNFKYSIIPVYINMKKSLNKKKYEKEIEMKYRLFTDFSTINNEIMSNFKGKYRIGKTFYDFKKNLNTISKFSDSKKLFFNSMKSSTIKKKRTNKIRFSQKLLSKKSSNSFNNNELFNSARDFYLPEDTFTIRYNQICGLETYAAIIKMIEKNISKRTLYSQNKDKDYQKTLGKNIMNKLFPEYYKENISNYMTLNEILYEINILLNKHKIDDEMYIDYLKNIIIKVKDLYKKNRLKLINPNPNQKIQPEKFKYKRYKPEIKIQKENENNQNKNTIDKEIK